MNTFERLTSDIKEYPVIGKNEDGEIVIIQRGEDENGNYVKVDTLQSNNWIRINWYYENGDMYETYDR